MKASISKLIKDIEKRRIQVSSKTKRENKSAKGQFFTPYSVASIMANFPKLTGEEIKILDPGAGMGCLTAAILKKILNKRKKPKRIHVTAVENDLTLIQELEQTLNDCFEVSQKHGVDFSYNIVTHDFITLACNDINDDLISCGLSKTFLQDYDLAILNPPYKKITGNSLDRILLSKVGIDTHNLYSAFVALSLKLLRSKGQLVSITPRSFCNGPYFKPFRENILKTSCISNIHIFDSRTKTFREDNVLLENLILHLIKGKKQANIKITRSDCAISTKRSRASHPNDVIGGSPDYFIHMIATDEDAEISRKMNKLPNNLSDLGIQVSTGRVVDFRVKEQLVQKLITDTVPMIFSTHIDIGKITWPIDNKKPNAIRVSEKTANLLLPSGNYIITKRFSAKEEKKRIVSAVLTEASFKAPHFGLDNMTNYFHSNNNGLKYEVAIGLSTYLNSSFVDNYFRQFSGHTQVNAADLRALKYPKEYDLIKIGKIVEKSPSNVELINNTIMKILFAP